MPYHPCVSGCDQDGHNCCLTCLGIQHAEEAFVNGLCSSYGDMTISELHNRLRNVKHGQSGIPHLSSTPQPVGMDRAGTSAERGTPTVSFGAPPDDRMSIAASEGELSLSALPPSGVVALSEPDPKMLSRAAEHVGLNVESSTASWFFEAGRVVSLWRLHWFSAPPLRAILPEVHEELTRS